MIIWVDGSSFIVTARGDLLTFWAKNTFAGFVHGDDMESRLALADSVVVDLHAERMRLVGDARAVMEALLAQSHRCKQTKITLSIAA